MSGGSWDVQESENGGRTWIILTIHRSEAEAREHLQDCQNHARVSELPAAYAYRATGPDGQIITEGESHDAD